MIPSKQENTPPILHPLSPEYLAIKKQAQQIVNQNYGEDDFKDILVDIYIDILLRENS